MRPGVEVNSRAAVPSRGPSVDTGRWFVVGETTTVPAAVKTVTNMDEFGDEFGARLATGLWDSAEAYFREGGSEMIVSAVANAALEATEITALDKFPKAMGPGQVSIDRAASETAHTALLTHAEENNRIALLDLADDADAADLITATDALNGLVNASWGGAFAPWVRIPGLTPSTTRLVPYAAIQAALISKSDRTNTANVPAAGANGEATYALSAERSWTDDDREDLNVAGVNVAIDVFGALRTYGYRTLVDPAGPDAQWLSLANARLRMQITAEAERIGEAFIFSQIDGRKQKISEFAGALTGMLSRLYDAGALFGETPDDAYIVDTGEAVNTEETLADNQLKAVLAVRMSPFAELVTIEIVKVPITESL